MCGASSLRSILVSKIRQDQPHNHNKGIPLNNGRSDRMQLLIYDLIIEALWIKSSKKR